jgi:hypothetical protein
MYFLLFTPSSVRGRPTSLLGILADPDVQVELTDGDPDEQPPALELPQTLTGCFFSTYDPNEYGLNPCTQKKVSVTVATRALAGASPRGQGVLCADVATYMAYDAGGCTGYHGNNQATHS